MARRPDLRSSLIGILLIAGATFGIFVELGTNWLIPATLRNACPVAGSCGYNVNWLFAMVVALGLGIWLLARKIRSPSAADSKSIIASNRTKYCKFCAQKVPENSVYCNSCGRQLMEPTRTPHFPYKTTKSRLMITAVCIIGLLLFSGIYLSYAYQHWELGDFNPGVYCPSLNSQELPCLGSSDTTGQVTGISSSSAPGWFLGIGEQPKVTIQVFVPLTDANFTQTFLGCASKFNINEDVFVAINVYNATWAYLGVPSTANGPFTTMSSHQVTNTTLDKTTTITYSSSSHAATVVLDETGRSYFVFPPNGCAIVHPQ